MANADTPRLSNIREIGAENICHNTWDKLKFTGLLLDNCFSDDEVALAATQVISRTVYPASELKTTSWIKENDVMCELTRYNTGTLTKDRLNQSALAFI